MAKQRRDVRQGGLFREYKRDRRKGSPTFGKSVPKSASWIAQYYVNGQRFRKSTGTAVKAEAEAKLREWMAASERGEKAKPQTQGLTYDSLRDDLLAHYAEKQNKSLQKRKDGTPYLYPQTALDAFFTGRRANDIDSDTASAFIQKRRAAGISNDAINSSLRLLRRMFTLARDRGKLTHVPKFELLRGKSRSGFLPHEQFQKLFNAVAAPYQPMLLLLYTTGVRVGEAKKVEWTAVDLRGAKITLLPGETKNDQPRILPLSDSLVKLLSSVEARQGRVFPKKRQMQFQFAKACKRAGIQGLLLHDLRRSAVRNLRKAGISEGVAMKISGHRDRGVFERYNVVDSQDVLEAGRILQAAFAPVKIAPALPPRKAAKSR